MAQLPRSPIQTLDDLRKFEAEMPLEQRLPERSVLDVFVGAAARHGERPAITMVMTGAPDEQPRCVTYGELAGIIIRAANLFSSLGGPRPGVAYLLPSLVETYVTLWGAEVAGYAIPINFLLQVEPIAELLKASQTRILVALGPSPGLDIWSKACALRALLPGLILVRVAPPGTPPEPGVIDFQTAVMEQPDDRLIFGEPGRDRDIAAYFHTGGTTGRPRLVAHSHHGQLVTAFGGAVLGGLGPTDTITATLPLFHVGGTIFCGLGVFMAGAHLLVMSPSGLRHPVVVQEFWRLVARHRATLVGGVPTALAAVLRSSFDGADLGSMRLGFTGAASLPPAVGDEFRRATGCRLHEIYGMTEASGVISVDAASDGTGQGSAGLPLPYTQVQVRRVGPDGRPGAPCAAGEIGVVIVQGPHVSPGYLDPDHNAGVLEGDTLDSGDLGYFDAQGQLHIAGRVKDLIIRSGHNVDPLMIENAMASHPAVATAAAVGMPDAYAGELPVCYVALHAGAQVAQDELAAHARNTIAERPAWPKQIYIVDAIPVTEVGKIYKPQLRCDAAVRAVRALLAERFALDSAHVEAHHGGVRGLRIAVRLPHQRREIAAPVEQALAAYLFESDVRVASDDT